MTRNEYSGLTIRPAQPAESEALSALALRSKAHWGYSPAFMQACVEELTYTAEQIRSDRYRFAIGEVAGTCAGFYALIQTSQDEAELEALFVDPPFIGRAIGRMLMEHAKGTATAIGASRLLIQGDPNAEGFYRAAGGILSGKRESGSIPGRYLPLFTIELI